MSVKFGLLALLTEQPMGLTELRNAFESRTGGTWPVNIGQVYTTLQRLDRDGLVRSEASAGEVEHYALTEEGRSRIQQWWSTPVQRGTPERQELVIKIALAVAAPGVEVSEVVQRQRTETMRALRDLTRLSARIEQPEGDDLAWSLVLDHHIFAVEAELRWLDHIESRAARATSAALPHDQSRTRNEAKGASR